VTTGDQTDADGTDDQGKQAVQTTDHGHDQPGAPGDRPADSTTADGTDWSAYDGPVWSAAEAARRCGISRSTLTRRLAAGAIPGAILTDKGWRIPSHSLTRRLQEGDIPGRPPGFQQADQQPADTDQGHGDATEDTTAQVAILTARLETERARREGAERLAEERAGRIRDLQTALRALTPPPADDDSTDGDSGDRDATDDDRPDNRARSASSPGHDTPTVTPTAQTAAQTTTPGPAASPQPRRGLFARLRDALTAD